MSTDAQNSYIRWKIFYLLRYYNRKMEITDCSPVAQLYKNVMYIEIIYTFEIEQIIADT